MSERKVTSNTFNKGMQLDVHPMNTPNDVMTSCLNGTIITFNGNEFMLQTDMGNGRVETAYLPAGYIPVGIVEFGGIIYVASYNPLINKSQIGSFPSPERNISTDELNKSVVSISNSDFGFDENNGANVFYVQKDLYNNKLTPGDKFIAYTKIGSIKANEGKLYDYPYGENNASENPVITKCVNLYFATITNEGKIVKLNNIKRYDIENGKKYIIPEISYNGDTPNLDSYRSIISSPYNIFNSKVSGKLLLIAELVTIDEFNISISCEFNGDDSNETKDVNIKAIISYTSDNNIFLYGIKAYIKDSEADEITKHFIWNNLSIENESQNTDNRNCIASMYNVIGYDYKNRPERNIKYEAIPCMPFGPINYLSKSGIIQLDKIGTGYIELYEWRYYIDNASININWALQSYPEEGHTISGVKFIMSCYNRNGDISRCIYDVSKKDSYNGSFTERIPFDKEYYKIRDGGSLLSNRLYYVTIEVQYAKIGSEDDDSRYKYFHKWLYTCPIFNKTYIDGTISDFEQLKPTININCSTETNINLKSSNQKEHIGECYIKESDIEGSPDDLNSMSAIKMEKEYVMSAKINPSILTSYNLFKLDNSTIKIKANVLNKNKSVVFDDYSIVSTDGAVDIYTEENLKLKEYKGYHGENINFPPLNESKNIINDPYNSGIYIENEINELILDGNNAIINNVNISIVEFAKAYARLYRDKITYKGTLRPAAYNKETFMMYNIQLSSYGLKHFKSIAACGFCNVEPGGDEGHIIISDFTGNKFGPKVGTERHNGFKADVLEDYIQEKMVEGWKTSSPIVMAIWNQNEDKKNSNLNNPSGGSLNMSWYKYDDMRNSITKYGIFCDDSGDGRKITKPEMGVLTFWKRASDKKYTLVNMMPLVGNSPESTDDLHIDKYICGGMDYLYNIIAAMLMQIYIYNDAFEFDTYWMPSSIYYINRFTTTFNINIDFDIITSKDTKIMVETDNESIIYIDSSMRNNLFNENKKYTNGRVVDSNSKTIDNNISFDYQKSQSSVPCSIQTLNSSTSLMNKLSEFNKKEYGCMCYKCDGNKEASDITGNPEYTYYVNDDGDFVKMNSNFKMYNVEKFDFSNELNYKAKLGSTIINDSQSSFANSIKVVDGLLYINDGNVAQVIKCNRGQSGKGDDGAVMYWSKFAPIKDFKVFI